MTPYVARVTLDEDGKWHKTHKPFEITEYDGWKTADGDYEVEDGEVLESGYGKQHYLFIIRAGEFIALGAHSPESAGIVNAYLRGEITLDDVYYMPPSVKHY